MKYIKNYNSVEDFNNSQPKLFQYPNLGNGGHPGGWLSNYQMLEKDSERYKGTYEYEYYNPYTHESTYVEHVFYVDKLNTHYIIEDSKEDVIETPTYEVTINDEVVNIVFSGDGYYSETTANTGTIMVENTPVTGYVDTFVEDEWHYCEFLTGSTVNPVGVGAGNIYVVEMEVVDEKEDIAIVFYDGFQSDSFKIDGRGKISIPKGSSEEFYEVDFVDGSIYCTDEENFGRYESGNTLERGIYRYEDRYWEHQGYVLTNQETGKQFLCEEKWENYYYYYDIDGMDEQDPTAYKLSGGYLSYGFMQCHKSAPVVGYETSVVPGVSYDKTNVHYNNRGFDFPSGYRTYTYEEVKFTETDYYRLLALYKRGNTCGYEYGIRIDGILAATREYGTPPYGEYIAPGLVFYSSKIRHGSSGDLCNCDYVFIDNYSKRIIVSNNRCA